MLKGVIILGKYLTDSAQTGAKISKNIKLFSYSLTETIPGDNGYVIYRFAWDFDGQAGHISIGVKDGKISNSSLIDTDPGSSHPFGRPLGLYNDGSLAQVFRQMLASINVYTNGVYSNF